MASAYREAPAKLLALIFLFILYTSFCMKCLLPVGQGAVRNFDCYGQDSDAMTQTLRYIRMAGCFIGYARREGSHMTYLLLFQKSNHPSESSRLPLK
jgi:hypothetical protein